MCYSNIYHVQALGYTSILSTYLSSYLFILAMKKGKDNNAVCIKEYVKYHTFFSNLCRKFI